MSSQLLIDHDKLAIVELTGGHHWLRLALWLSNEFRGGELVRLERGARVSIEGFDALSASYDRANWLSGVTSGALYAFRTLGIPRQRVILTELAGHLDAADMEAVANAAAIAISTLASKELNVPAQGWVRLARLTERPAIDSTVDEDDRERPHAAH